MQVAPPNICASAPEMALGSSLARLGEDPCKPKELKGQKFKAGMSAEWPLSQVPAMLDLI